MTGDTTERTSENETETETPERRRTVVIWLIFAFMCFSMLNTIYALAANWLDWKNLGVPKMGPAFILLTVISGCVDFAAGLALFNLRTAAVRLLAIGLVVSVSLSLYWVVTFQPTDFGDLSDVPFAVTLGGVFIVFVPLVIYCFILVFALRLRRRGVLR